MVGTRIVRWCCWPAIVSCAGCFSAFFVNDTMCLVLTPLVLEITTHLRRNPVPYLLAVAMASNIGSVATITGNPQNMMIGSFSRIPYREFAARARAVAAVGLVLTVARVIARIYRAEFRAGRTRGGASTSRSASTARCCGRRWRCRRAMIVVLLRRLARAQGGAGGRGAAADHAPGEAGEGLREIDWPLLVMFVGLFIVVAGVEKAASSQDASAVRGPCALENVACLSGGGGAACRTSSATCRRC